MLRRFGSAALFLAALGAAAPAPAAAAVTVTDDRGVRFAFDAPPARIIALSPHLAEIVFAAGAGAQLAAAVRYSDYPQEAARLPQVGDASRIDVEGVIALKPDLLLAWRTGNPAGDVERLERLGFRVFVTEPARLTDIARLMRTIGTLAGTGAVAEPAAATLERDLSTLRARYAQASPVRVFYEIWHRPLLTVNHAHLISDVLMLCGGRNIFADVPVLTPSISLEAVLAGRPDVVLGGSSAMQPGELETKWRSAPIAALRDIPVRYVPADLIQRQTPRIVQGARAVCGHLEDVRAARARKP